MPYDENLALRIERVIHGLGVDLTTKNMMGGRLFQVDDKMLCGIHIDKKYGDSLLMARVGEKAYTKEIEKPECLPMDFTGRPIKGYIFVTPDGFQTDKDLEFWIKMCHAFNPEAKASEK